MWPWCLWDTLAVKVDFLRGDSGSVSIIKRSTLDVFQIHFPIFLQIFSSMNFLLAFRISVCSLRISHHVFNRTIFVSIFLLISIFRNFHIHSTHTHTNIFLLFFLVVVLSAKMKTPPQKKAKKIGANKREKKIHHYSYRWRNGTESERASERGETIKFCWHAAITHIQVHHLATKRLAFKLQ